MWETFVPFLEKDFEKSDGHRNEKRTVYKKEFTTESDNPTELIDKIVSNIKDFIPGNHCIVINAGHYNNNVKIDSRLFEHTPIKPPILSSLTFKCGIELYKELSNNQNTLSYFLNDFALDKKERNIIKDGRAPFPKEYKTIIYENLGEKNIFLLTPREYTISKKKMYSNPIYLGTSLPILILYESTLRNRAAENIKKNMDEGLIVENNENNYTLNSETTGSCLWIANKSTWDSERKNDRPIPICRYLIYESLRIYRNKLGADTVLYLNSFDEFDCQGLYSHIFYRLEKPDRWLNNINVYFQKDDNDDLIKAKLTYFLCDVDGG